MAYIDREGFLGDQKTLEMSALTLTAFIAPFMIHEQLFLGILVNALLIRAAYSLPGKRSLSVIMAPSIGAFMNGLLFGPFTVFLAYLMPAIWLGNAALVYVYKRLRDGRYAATVLLASGTKAAVLFSAAYILYTASVIPEAFLASMGILQFATALFGGIAAYKLKE